METKEEVLKQKAKFFADLAAPHFNENDYLDDLLVRMQKYAGNVAIVVSEKNDQYGIITKSEILGSIDKFAEKNKKIKDITEFKDKIKNNISNSAKDSDSLKEAIRKLKNQSLKPIPLLDSNDSVIGIVTQDSISKGLDYVLS